MWEMYYICSMNVKSDMFPALEEMLSEMRQALTEDDITAGLPYSADANPDVSSVYVTWTELLKRRKREEELIAELDADIQRMSVWADYPMARIDQLSHEGKVLSFWRARTSVFRRQEGSWTAQYHVAKVAEEGGYCYFTAETPVGTALSLPEAERIEVCPSPVSTLIMLQTKAKDSLRNIVLEIGDFAMQHYTEVETALGLEGTIQPAAKRKRLLNKLRHLVKKVKRS